jgi:hypothetical protein
MWNNRLGFPTLAQEVTFHLHPWHGMVEALGMIHPN